MRVQVVQINTALRNSHWLPYSVGCLIAYANSQPDISQYVDFSSIIFKREHPDIMINKMTSPDVVAFSLYMWNRSISIRLAHMVKEKWPDCYIIFGGPSAQFSQAEQGICDIVIEGEGEYHFASALREIINGSIDTSYYKKQQIQVLDDLPSPYLTGVFDTLIEDHPEDEFLATIETNRGCPYSCTFCDWGGNLGSKIKKFPIEKVYAEIDWTLKHNIVEIALGDANFGIFRDRDLGIARYLRSLYDSGSSRVKQVLINYLKNNTDASIEIAEILGEMMFMGITISKQTDSSVSLKAIKRSNIKHENYAITMEKAWDKEILTYTEILLPLPQETADSFRQGIMNVLEGGQHNHIDVYHTQLITHAEMNQPDYRERYGIQSETIDLIGFSDDMIYGDDTREKVEVIVATNTMTTDEMLDCWEYVLLVNMIHLMGFSEVISRYLNYTYGVSYREFYDDLFVILRQNKTFKIMFEKERIARQRMINIKIDAEDVESIRTYWGRTHFVLQFLLANQTELYEILYSTAEQYGSVPDEVRNMQESFIIDETMGYPLKFYFEQDFLRKKSTAVEYVFTGKSAYTNILNHGQSRWKSMIEYHDIINTKL